MAKKYNRPKMSSWCILRNSSRLRNIVKMRMEQKGVTQLNLAERTGIPRERISRYLNERSSPVTQYQLITICGILGLEVDLLIKLKE